MNYRSSDEAIQEIMNVTGITPDEAQMKVLKHIGGMCILSTAGSGKTEILTQLTSKRILTGEIKDVKKVLLTTYSVGGREELEDRINKMLKRLGIKKKLEVRTLHSSYLLMLNQVGYNPKIMAGYERTNLIKQACLDTNVRLDEEALLDLDTILSYQINNMMTDEILYKQNNFNIDITLNQYKMVAAKFRELKIKSGLNDFDDLQMLVLNLLRTNEDARKLFRSLWEYYYIDEFQDVSKIQFEILKMLIQNPDNLVVIGDDDQCLIEGTQVRTLDGYKAIEDFKVEDSVLSATGNGNCSNLKIVNKSSKYIKENIMVIKTHGGRVVRGTKNHLGFANMPSNLPFSYYLYLTYTKDVGFRLSDRRGTVTDKKWVINQTNSMQELEEFRSYYIDKYNNLDNLEDGYRLLKDLGLEFKYPHDNNSIIDNDTLQFTELRFGKLPFREMPLGSFIEGMVVPVYVDGKIYQDTVYSVEEEYYEGNVYDISVPKTHNFVANDVVVHNCIYEWRGADPNIIQNICGYYDIAQFVLNMNYRCGENIVRPASRTIENNSNRVDKTIKAFNSGGKLIVENMGNSMYEISAGIADYVLGLIKQGVKEEDIAILCRNNIHGVIIHDMISTITIPRAVKDMRFGSNSIANDIDFCVELVKDSVNHRQVSNLWKLVKYLPASQCGLIGKIMYNNGCSLAVAIKSILVDLYDIDIIDNVKEIRLINNKNYTGLRDLKDDSVNGLYNLYITLTNTSLSEEDKAIKVIENYLNVTVGFIYKDPDKKRMVFAIADYIIDLICQKGIDGYIKHFNLSKRHANLEMPPTRNCISISTMNGSKGKQWKYVVLVADDNLSMPSFRIIKDMIDERTPILEVSNYIEQERRLHYVAMTRAKEELRVFTTQGKQSVYLLEALGIIKKENGDRLNTHVLDIIQNNGYDETLKKQIEEVMKDYKA